MKHNIGIPATIGIVVLAFHVLSQVISAPDRPALEWLFVIPLAYLAKNYALCILTIKATPHFENIRKHHAKLLWQYALSALLLWLDQGVAHLMQGKMDELLLYTVALSWAYVVVSNIHVRATQIGFVFSAIWFVVTLLAMIGAVVLTNPIQPDYAGITLTFIVALGFLSTALQRRVVR